STASATSNGSGPATSDLLDAPQAFIGGSPPSNFFARYATGNPPVSPAGNFTRGDSLIASLMAPSSASTVSESFLSGTASSTLTAGSSVAASLLFMTGATAGPLTIAYNYANDIFTFTSGAANVTAHYNFDITIKDLNGNVVFNSSTSNTNLTLASPPNGPEL